MVPKATLLLSQLWLHCPLYHQLAECGSHCNPQMYSATRALTHQCESPIPVFKPSTWQAAFWARTYQNPAHSCEPAKVMHRIFHATQPSAARGKVCAVAPLRKASQLVPSTHCAPFSGAHEYIAFSIFRETTRELSFLYSSPNSKLPGQGFNKM